MNKHPCVPLLLVLAACDAPAAPPPPAMPEAVQQAPSAKVSWLVPEPAARAAWLEAPARVAASPNASWSVGAPLTARVRRIHVRPGQTVEKGEPLIDLMLPELLRAAGAMAAADLRIQAFEQRRTRLEPLVKQKLARAAELSDLEASLALARAERQAARATLRVAGVGEARAQRLLRDNGSLTLRAPVRGMVVSVSAQAGRVLEPGSEPLVELMGEGRVQIEAQFPFAPDADLDYVWLSDGHVQPVVLEAVSPRASPGSGTRTAWFRLPEGSPAAPAPGSLGRVRPRGPEEGHVLPRAALLQEDDRAQVVVLRDGVPVRQPVRVRLLAGGEAIVEGLDEGARVASDAREALSGDDAR